MGCTEDLDSPGFQDEPAPVNQTVAVDNAVPGAYSYRIIGHFEGYVDPEMGTFDIWMVDEPLHHESSVDDDSGYVTVEQGLNCELDVASDGNPDTNPAGTIQIHTEENSVCLTPADCRADAPAGNTGHGIVGILDTFEDRGIVGSRVTVENFMGRDTGPLFAHIHTFTGLSTQLPFPDSLGGNGESIAPSGGSTPLNTDNGLWYYGRLAAQGNPHDEFTVQWQFQAGSANAYSLYGNIFERVQEICADGLDNNCDDLKDNRCEAYGDGEECTHNNDCISLYCDSGFCALTCDPGDFGADCSGNCNTLGGSICGGDYRGTCDDGADGAGDCQCLLGIHGDTCEFSCRNGVQDGDETSVDRGPSCTSFRACDGFMDGDGVVDGLGVCPDTTVFSVGGRTYALWDELDIWANHKMNCADMGYTLATIETDEEWTAIWGTGLITGTVWLGLSDVVSELDWVTTATGLTIGSTRWAVPPANDVSENCVRAANDSDGYWDDVPCTENHYALCEVPYGHGAVASDSDSDGIYDFADFCPDDPANDADGDGHCGGPPALADDNCPAHYNPDQTDTDSDGMGDLCDVDIDYDNGRIPGDPYCSAFEDVFSESDCSNVCGDNILDANENCDGRGESDCPGLNVNVATYCDDSDACTTDYLLLPANWDDFGRVERRQVCSPRCQGIRLPGTGVTGCSCTGDMNCGENYTCVGFACSCVAPSPCHTAAVVDGACVFTPLADATICGDAMSCQAEACVPDMELYGQSDFRQAAVQGGTPSASTFSMPQGLTSVDGTWVVSDFLNQRVLLFGDGMSSPATLVLGQPDFDGTGNDRFRPTPGADTLYRPVHACGDSERLIVVDRFDNRVLIWSPWPTVNGEAADLVLGQLNMTDTERDQGGTPTAGTLDRPTRCWMSDGRLYITDYSNNRILIWNTFPAVNGAAADVVLGQADFVSSAEASPPSATSLSTPFAVGGWGASGAYVTESGTDRVLFWDDVDDFRAGVGADRVLGQPDFESTGYGTSVAELKNPVDVVVSGSSVYVSDSGNHRIMVWNSTTPANGSPATGVLGQADFDSGSSNAGASEPSLSTLYSPNSIAIDGTSLLVADNQNNRILEFSPLPTGSESATTVLGQPNGATTWPNGKLVDATGLDQTNSFVVTDDYLIVPDRNNGRVLIVDKDLTGTDFEAAVVIGKPDATTRCVRCVAPSSTWISEATTVDVDGSGRLYVGDRYHHRVLVYNTIPTVTGAAADFVLGQEDFDSSGFALGWQWLNMPGSVTVDGSYLYVAEIGNHRVLRYDLPIIEDGQAATLVIGQADETTNSIGTAADEMGEAMGVFAADNRLYVGDHTNARILVYDPIPTTSGESAAYVLGQATFGAATPGLTDTQFHSGMYALRMDVRDGYLWVPDRLHYRILGFELSSLSSGMAATRVLGQADFVSEEYQYSNEAGSRFTNPYSPESIYFDTTDGWVYLTEQGASRVTRIRLNTFDRYVVEAP